MTAGVNRPSWIVRRALGEMTATDVGAFWRNYGYWGGPHVLDAFIDHYRASGKPDYQYLLKPKRKRRSQSELNALIDQAIYVRLAPIEEFWSALLKVPRRLDEMAEHPVTCERSTFDLTGLIAQEMQSAAKRRAQEATESHRQSCSLA